MTLLTTTGDLAEACDRLAQHPYATVDTEFLREHTYWPKLCLIQLAGPGEGDEFIVDPLADGIDLEPFYALMSDAHVTKVFHAARQDLEIVYTRAGLIPAPLFDTQVAAMVCGFGDSVSYVNLVKHVTNVSLDKGMRFTDWSRRPLNPKQLKYAMADVTHLRDVYQHLSAHLDQNDRRHWLDEEMAILSDPDTYVVKPSDAWQRMKLRVKNKRAMAVLMELAAWRERMAQELDVPRNRVIRDEALYDIANQAPTTPEQLGDLRSVSDGFHRSNRARGIIEAVQTGLDRDLADVPSPKAGRALSPTEAATVELLKVLLKSCAAEHDVAAKMLADTRDLEIIACEDNPKVAAMRGWRHDIFGCHAVALKEGRIALTVDDGRIAAVPR